MYCGQCGEKLPDGAAFCPFCGAKTATPAAVSGSAQAESGNHASTSNPTAYISHAASAKTVGYGANSNPKAAATAKVNAKATPSAKTFVETDAPADHPYRKLGGYLAVVVYGCYIGGALAIVASIVGIVQTIMLYSQFAQYGMYGLLGQALAIDIAGWIAAILIALYAFWWGTVIKNRNPKFLLYYHVIMIICIIGLFIFELATAGILVALISAIFYVAVLALFTLYAVKSQRVRIYFGSDQYLRESPLTRSLVS